MNRHLAILLGMMVLLTAFVAPVDAQEGNTTATTSSSANASDPASAPAVDGDPDLHIVDYRVDDGTMFVELYAERSAMVSVSAPPSGDSDMAGGYIEQVGIEPRTSATISIRSPEGVVWISSTDSVRNGRFTQLDTSGPGFLPSEFTGNDVLVSGGSAALLTGAAVLVGVYRWRYETEDNGGERLA